MKKSSDKRIPINMLDVTVYKKKKRKPKNTEYDDIPIKYNRKEKIR